MLWLALSDDRAWRPTEPGGGYQERGVGRLAPPTSTLVGRAGMGVLLALFPALASVLLRSHRNPMPVAVCRTRTLRLSSGSVFRRTRSNSDRRSRARVMAGFDRLPTRQPFAIYRPNRTSGKRLTDVWCQVGTLTAYQRNGRRTFLYRDSSRLHGPAAPRRCS